MAQSRKGSGVSGPQGPPPHRRGPARVTGRALLPKICMSPCGCSFGAPPGVGLGASGCSKSHGGRKQRWLPRPGPCPTLCDPIEPGALPAQTQGLPCGRHLPWTWTPSRRTACAHTQEPAAQGWGRASTGPRQPQPALLLHLFSPHFQFPLKTKAIGCS